MIQRLVFGEVTRMIRLFLSLLVIVHAGGVFGAVPQRDVRILLVGNSFTSRNNMAKTMERYVSNSYLTVRPHIRTIATDGFSFEDHLNDDKTVESLKSCEWDYIVLQARTGLTWRLDGANHYSDPAEFWETLRQYSRLLASCSTTVLLFEPWFSGERSFSYYDYVFVAGANRAGLRLAPVGRVFRRLQGTGEVRLTLEDGHPTPHGSDVIAVCLATSIFGLPDSTALSELRATGGLPEGIATATKMELDALGSPGFLKEPPRPEYEAFPTFPTGEIFAESDLVGRWSAINGGTRRSYATELLIAGDVGGKLGITLVEYTPAAKIKYSATSVQFLPGQIMFEVESSSVDFTFGAALSKGELVALTSSGPKDFRSYRSTTFRKIGDEEYLSDLRKIYGLFENETSTEGLASALARHYDRLRQFEVKWSLGKLDGRSAVDEWDLILPAWYYFSLDDVETGMRYLKAAQQIYPNSKAVKGEIQKRQ